MERAQSGRNPRLLVRPLERTDWPAIERLFGERGACAGCWCMAWRVPQKAWEAQRGAANRRAFRKLVMTGRASGVLAFARDGANAGGQRAGSGARRASSPPALAGEPVGWCSVAPRADFAGLATRRSLATDWDERTWSVTCFFIAKGWRGRGVAGRLLRAAVALARERGASRIEGYPAAPPQAGGALPAAFAWTGVPSVFEQAGFARSKDAPGKRSIYMRVLGRR